MVAATPFSHTGPCVLVIKVIHQQLTTTLYKHSTPFAWMTGGCLDGIILVLMLLCMHFALNLDPHEQGHLGAQHVTSA